MNPLIRCIVVEDEPIAAGIMRDYISEIPFLQLKAVCKDAFEAMEVLQAQPIDLIFLDIHLPRLRGLDFLQTIQVKPKVILTTAYHEYALEAFDLDVVDYLLKPISFTRFIKAVNKVQMIPNSSLKHSLGESTQDRFRYFNVNKKQVKVNYDEVLYLESEKDYTRIHTRYKSILVQGSLGHFEEEFASYGFLRIHRSFMVAKEKISAYSYSRVEIDDITLPIGRSYKEYVIKQLGKNRFQSPD